MASLEVSETAVPPDSARAPRWGLAVACLVALGATVGVALDHMHVASGTISYPLPYLFGQAWWAFPLFAAAPVPLGLARPALERLVGARIEPPSTGRTWFAMTAFIAAYLTSGLFPGGSVARAVALLGIFVAVWWVADRRPLGLFLAAGAAIVGTGVEVLLVATGMFSYEDPDVMGVAGWLPLLYATAGVAVGALGSYLVDGPRPIARTRVSTDA